MRQKFFITAALVLLLAPAHASAQTDEHKFEVGAVFTALGADSEGAAKGIGLRFGYNINEYLAVDAETSFFPSDQFGNNLVGQNAQGFVGVKAGKRTKYVGIFAKARPGVMFIGNSTSGLDCDDRGAFSVCRPEHNHLALDAGVVAEFYPSSRTIIRVDLGDTIVRFRDTRRDISDVTHNLQASIGFGFRF
jgi:hypothetical protein